MPKNDQQKFTLSPNFKIENNEERLFEDIFYLCKALNFIPKKICQIGAANSENLEYMEFIENGSKALLFEPNPPSYEELKNKFSYHPNISIFKIGIYNKSGKFKFDEDIGCTSISEIAKTPIKCSSVEKPSGRFFYGECAKISGFDDGDIDLLLIDTEGSEFECIQHLISRPVLICIETHYIYSSYINPNIEKIYAWMTLNNYCKIAQNESDTIFMSKSYLR